MIDKLDLEFIREIDCQNIYKVIILASSYNDIYQITFDGVINFSYSIDDEKDGFSPDELDIIELKHQYDYPTKEMLLHYSYKSSKELMKNKYHHLYVYGDLELTILSKEMIVNQLSHE